ncbi:10363_t:CDS:2, partial [Racocetra persica]
EKKQLVYETSLTKNQIEYTDMDERFYEFSNEILDFLGSDTFLPMLDEIDPIAVSNNL